MILTNFHFSQHKKKALHEERHMALKLYAQ